MTETESMMDNMTGLIFPVDSETVEERFTGRLRWGKDGRLQQEVMTILYPTGSTRVGWVVVSTEE